MHTANVLYQEGQTFFENVLNFSIEYIFTQTNRIIKKHVLNLIITYFSVEKELDLEEWQ
jgi:hypothetical protein